MATAYEIAFKYEILNEFIAHLDARISRKFGDENLPSDMAALHNELWDIYRKLPFEDDMNVLDGYDDRLAEIRDYIDEQGECEYG